MKRSKLFIYISLIAHSIYGQFYQSGTDKPFIKHNCIETEHFSIIYPEKYFYEGNKLANLLEESYRLVSQTLDQDLKKKVPVLLHTDIAISNGFVAWAPRRSELINTSPQISYSQDWLTQLALHEGRHIVQLSKLESGVAGIFKILFGQGVTGILAGMYPLWAYEGDAVVTETAVTQTGRGRSPSFLMGAKAISLDIKKNYSYEKTYFGSYKDYVPDYYSYGYIMSSTARVKYDSLFWENILSDIPSKCLLLYPTYFSLKKRYGLSKRKLYNESMQYYKTTWESDTLEADQYKKKNNRQKKEYTSYRYPVITENNSVICEKSNLSSVNRFVEINSSGKEKIVTYPGSYIPTRLSYGNNKLVWSEIVKNPRWEFSQKSVIKVLDTQTRNKKTIGKKSKYFAPSINNDGTKIVAVETGKSENDYLVIFDINSTKILQKIIIKKDKIQMPSWHPHENKIVYTRITENGKVIEVLNLEDNTTEIVLNNTHEDISSPIFFNHYIIFTASFGGIDNIFAIEPQSNELFKLTNSKYGAFDPAIDTNNNILYFSEYSSQGYNISYQEISENDFKKYNAIQSNEPKITALLSDQEKNKFSLKEKDYKIFEESRYHKWKHLINIHTWVPFYINPDPEEIFYSSGYPGLLLFSQNIIGTLYGWGGYSYHDGSSYGNINMTYKGLWPVFDVNYQYGGVPSIDAPGYIIAAEPLKENKRELTASIYLPFLYNFGPFFLNIKPIVKLHTEDYYKYIETENILNKSNIIDLQKSASFFIYTKLAKRDIYPKIGLLVSAKRTTAPNNNSYGSLDNYTIKGFVPGILKNHSLRYSMYLQNQNYKTQDYRFSNSVSFPRGFTTYVSDKISMQSFDYTIPVIYPDLRIFNLAYIKRIRADLFYDYAFVKGIKTLTPNNIIYLDYEFYSWGTEIYFDTHIAHSFFPLSFGVRISYKPQYDETIFEPVFSFSLGDL